MELAAVHNISRAATPKKQQPFFGKKRDPAFFAPAVIQPKLTIAPVNDPYETEADAVADKVMRMSSAETVQAKPSPLNIQRKCDACEAEEKLQRMEDEELQMKPDAGYAVQRKCAACEGEDKIHLKAQDEDEPVQLKAANNSSIQRQCADCEHEEQDIHRKEAAPAAMPAVTPSVHQTLQSSGHQLDSSARRFMESRFGYDFGDVQIHNDPKAHQSSKDIKARAYTHGKHIVFGEGQYQPETHAGKQLLAHELTHVVQQNGVLNRKADENVIQRDGLKDSVVPPGYGIPLYNDQMIEVDIKGQKKLQLPEYLGKYLVSYFANGADAPIMLKYGDLGSGLIYVKCPKPGFEEICERDPRLLIVPLLYLAAEACHDQFDPTTSLYSATRQVIPISLPHLDTSTKPGTLVLNIQINNSEITGRIGWLANVGKVSVDPFMSYDAVDFSDNALLPFIYGNDYKGDNFKKDYYMNGLKDGKLRVASFGELSLPNLQKIQGIFQTGSVDKIWNTTLTTNIKGANAYPLPINRTDQGLLSGEGSKLEISGDWTGKGFTAAGSLKASFINSNLSVIGRVSYKSDRGHGELFLAVTDYLTARKYALDYLPDEIGELAAKDTLPANANERLAFVGAGNIHLTLFNGNKEADHPVKGDDSFIERQDKDKHRFKNIDPAAEVIADFVVEPEGYITVAGEIKQPEKDHYPLFEKLDYKKTIELLPITVGSIPLPLTPPLPLVHFDFDITVSLEFGASVGPLTLSQLTASGIYSNRPGAYKELELSGFLQLDASVFANLVFELAAKVGAGPFTVTILSKKITFGASMGGSIYARPTIKIRSSDDKVNLPPDYSITGNFDFDAAGSLSYQISDRIKADATKDEADNTKTPDTYKYLNGKKKDPESLAGKDVVVPLDCSLGDEEPPVGVSVKSFKELNLGTALNKIIKGRKDDEYFEKGTPGSEKDESVKSDGKHFSSGHYMEGGQTKGRLKEKVKPIAGPKGAEKPTLVFSQGFTMMGEKHTLYLIVDMVREDGKVKKATVNVEMASDMEPLDSKIKEEETEIKKTVEPTDDFQEKDLMIIKKKEEELKAEVTDLAKNNELNEETPVPQALELTVPMQTYGTRYHQKDLGKRRLTHRQGNCEKEPKGIINGVDIIFYNPANHSIVNGVVIELENRPDVDGRNNWLIAFRPASGRMATVLRRRAYDDDCKPTYLLPKANNECNVHLYPEPVTVKEPARHVNGKQYYGSPYIKPIAIQAYPLCWSTYQQPKALLVGMDRIKEERRWHRTHLVDGKLGGAGIAANLVPAPKRINNDIIPPAYEDDLKDMVATGRAHKYYWFKAEVEYYKPEDNYDIKHYDDFVKSIKITYGPAEPKDPAKGVKELGELDWKLLNEDKFETTIDLGNDPSYKDIKSTRTEG